MNMTDSFIRGFNYGKRLGHEVSAREIARQFPDVNIDAFAQGMVDGVTGDRFRLGIALKESRKAA